MNLAEGMFSTLGMTPIGAVLHDPPNKVETWDQPSVPRAVNRNRARTLNLLTVSQRLIHGLAEVNPVIT